ncbi:hypothetical protein TA3x_000265 [Tundrisphaera sp. TA3]|uniref:hypothetical protein n=1 Tax=Tundrisphaera sp. TA3 TaxID=3435775 RepID=UPI003EC0EA88
MAAVAGPSPNVAQSNPTQGFAHRPDPFIHGPGLGLTKSSLELREGPLDRVQVRAGGGQITNFRDPIEPTGEAMTVVDGGRRESGFRRPGLRGEFDIVIHEVS